MYGDLRHHGIKGQKWGVRRYQRKDGTLTKAGLARYKDEVNSKSRNIKSGTELQNISSREYDHSKTKRLYVSYTSYDKDAYVDLMGNYMYGGKAYKNTFVVKKDLKVASDKEVVDAFVKVAKENPVQTAKDMANAYNYTHAFMRRTEKMYNKKISELTDSVDKKSIKMAKDFVRNAVMDPKAEASSGNFYSYLTKKGFDAISDTNDRSHGAQDPLIILNLDKIQQKGSVKLTDKDLEAYFRYTQTTNHINRQYDVSEIQHGGGDNMNNDLQHHGIKGQKWGVRRFQNSDGSLTPEGRKRYDDDERNSNSRVAGAAGNGRSGGGSNGGSNGGKKGGKIDNINRGVNMTKSGVNDLSNARSRKRENDSKRNYRDEAKQMTDKELRDAVNRLNMEENYTRMMSGRNVDNGKNFVDSMMNTTMTALSLTSTVLGIALAVKELKG